MKEQLYTIPVTDAFQSDCECPLCKMKADLEQNAIEYTLGPSYMEDDNRAMTDESGFCEKHIQALYSQSNRLGLALILSTHLSKTRTDLKALSAQPPASGKAFFGKKSEQTPMGAYIEKLSHDCFICRRVEQTLERYVNTIFQMYKKDAGFSAKIRNAKGFCTYHYGLLFGRAGEYLSKDQLQKFIQDINGVFFSNMERMQEDIDWFINKFDYRYQNEPWKNAKDALPRAILKTHSSVTSDTKL